MDMEKESLALSHSIQLGRIERELKKVKKRLKKLEKNG